MPANWLEVHDRIFDLLGGNEDFMLYGGAGSGKTWTWLDICLIRALEWPGSLHGCFRQRFEHVKTTLWKSAEALIDVEFPELKDAMETNKSGGSWDMILPNGSQLYFGGLDDKERIEKHLGTEFATVYINECSEIQDENNIELISSRLRQKIPGRHLLLTDMNPPSKKHWSYKRYITDEGKVPGRIAMRINPIDVKENLPESYIKRLENLPDRLRQRFLYGEFTVDVEGALWSYDMLENIKQTREDFGRIVIGVDPAVTSKEESDETGIVVVGMIGDDQAHVIADYTGKYKPSEWAQKVADAYDLHRADVVVAETNQGGDLVESNLKNHHQNMNIEQVRATRGKHVRAEPVAALYEQGKITHEPGLEELESQMLEWVPGVGDSPDRVDALVWALTDLLVNRAPKISFGSL